jgi:tRNA threonylcarbamoyl adenosine modification protein YeaZ
MTHDPLTLALDTSHRTGSVAVARGEVLLGEIVFDASDTHSATLLPAVDACLRIAGVLLGGIDRFAVSSGPGSFTGLRIGLATVKAFAAVNRRPVVAVASLEVLAAAIPFSRHPVLALIDARRGEVYGALYDTGEGAPVELTPPFSCRPARAVELAMGSVERAARRAFDTDGLMAGGARRERKTAGRVTGATGAPLVLCGTGAEHYRELLEEVLPPGSLFAQRRWSVPSGAILAILSLGKAALPYEEIAPLEPLYLRAPDARLPAGARRPSDPRPPADARPPDVAKPSANAKLPAVGNPSADAKRRCGGGR